MPEMTDSELLVVLNSFESDSTAYNDEFMRINEELLRRYNRELYGDEEEGRSRVVASDVSDLVDSDMTSLVRVFLGSQDVMVFEPNTDDPEEAREAEEKTRYVNHIIRKRPESYKCIHDFMKDAETQKMGVVHYYMDEEKKTRTIEYEQINTIRIGQLLESIEAESDKIDKVDIIAQQEIKGGIPEEPEFDVTFRITETIKKIRIDTIQTEDFLISKNASSEDEANLVGHIQYVTRSELVASGISKNKVAKFPSSSTNSTNGNGTQNTTQSATGSVMKDIRWRDEGGNGDLSTPEWASELVKVVNMYVKVDFDGDGIAERRYIRKIGNTIQDNEPFDHVPYAILSSILDPHKAIGRGRADLVVEDQKVNTVLRRGILDNIYKVNHPRTAVGQNVDLDDMLDIRLDGIIRVNDGGSPANEIMPIVTPYIGDKALQVAQYLDTVKSNRAGTLMASQGLEADNLNKETATRFNGVEKAAEAKIELVARNFAETGFRKLYDGVAWLAAHYQDQDEEFRVLGKALSVKPTDWKFNHNPVSQVGLGAGNGQQAVQNMSGILAIQSQLKAEGSMLVDDQKTYNALNEMVMGLDLSRTDMFFNNPDIPEQMLMAHVQKLTAALQQSQQMIDQLQQSNPLAEAEQIRAEASLINAKNKETVELIKTQAQTEQKQMEMVQDGAQFQATLERQYTELELKHGVDVPGQGQGQ